jgi:hypothetical protein
VDNCKEMSKCRVHSYLGDHAREYLYIGFPQNSANGNFHEENKCGKLKIISQRCQTLIPGGYEYYLVYIKKKM